MEWLNTPLIVIAVLALVSAIGGGIWKVATWKAHVDSDRSTFKSSLESFIKEIRDDIKGILSRLPPPRLVETNSPLGLSDFGKKVAKEMNAHKWAADLAPSLLDEVKHMAPFQIDEFAAKCTQSKLTEYWEGVVAATAYNTGQSRDDIRVALHITLRDELLRMLKQADA
jgi:hypothetical protein